MGRLYIQYGAFVYTIWGVCTYNMGRFGYNIGRLYIQYGAFVHTI